MMVFAVVLQAVLPVGVRTSKKPKKGHAASAPENPNMKRKFLATTLISLIITGLLIWVIEEDIFGLSEMYK